MGKRIVADLKFSRLTKKLDAVFSLWIRRRDGGRCFTCGKTDDPKRMQNGHYVPRSHRSLRWDERNCHCQCVACNVFRHGNMDVYALRLIAEYGDGILAELERKKRETKRWTTGELERMVEKYSAR